MLHGSLDPTMPVERLARLREVFSRANQTFVVVPDAGHVVINESECVQAIYLAFLASPTAVPDTACVANAPRLSSAGDDSTSVALFGTADMWGDRVSFVRTFTFYLVFRYQAPLIGFCLLAIGIAVVRRSIRPEIGSVELRHPVRRLVVGAGLWLLVSVGFWFAEFVLPLLLDYNGWTTVLLVAALVMMHITIGRWLISWIGTGYRRSIAEAVARGRGLGAAPNTPQ